MSIKTVSDVIQEAIEKAFDDNGVDIDKFSHDMTAFSSTGVRAMAIYDDCELEKTFILVGLSATVDKSYKVIYFKNTSEGVGVGHYDGIDAMSDAETFLMGY
jgi:hypothetical protein